MKKILWFFLVICFAIPAVADTQTLAESKIDLLQKMQADGYLTDAAADAAKQKYILEDDKNYLIVDQRSASIPAAVANQVEDESSWTQYFSLINFIKVLAVILLLVAFSGIIKKIILGCWALIAVVPVWVYQGLFLTATVCASFFPAYIWLSQLFYIALFGIFGSLMIVVWILATWDKLRERLIKLVSFGLPLVSVISFLLMMYFGLFAIVYQSSFLGFFAAVALSGVFTFSLFYMPGILFFQFKENALAAMVFGHLVALSLYIILLQLGIALEYLTYFNAGIQYYCTLALGVALLVGSSPFYEKASVFYFLIFIAVCVVATFLYFFAGLTGMAIILYVLFVLVFLEWITYLGFKTGVITGLLLIGGLLFAIALILERYAGLILNQFKI